MDQLSYDVHVDPYYKYYEDKKYDEGKGEDEKSDGHDDGDYNEDLEKLEVNHEHY